MNIDDVKIENLISDGPSRTFFHEPNLVPIDWLNQSAKGYLNLAPLVIAI